MIFGFEPGIFIFLLVAGFIGGVWNSIAGAATLFTFPVLVMAGLPPVIANATNFLALLPANAAALPAYVKELKEVGRKPIILMIIASGLGAILGSYLLIYTGEALFVSVVPYLILAATLLFAFGDQIRAFMLNSRFAALASGTVGPLVLMGLFSIYGGYFGAGLGIILLAIVQIMGYSDFLVANSLKNLLATTFTIISIFIFGLNGLIHWPAAGVMMVASTAGGYLGGRLSKYVNAKYLRAFVITFGLFLSFYYMFFK